MEERERAELEPLEAAHRAIAAHLRAERARRGLTQKELAAATGLDESTIWRIEKGRRAMSLDQLIAIATVFRLTPGDFLNGAYAEMQHAAPVHEERK